MKNQKKGGVTISNFWKMGNTFMRAVGNVLTETLGNVLTAIVGKVLDIYTTMGIRTSASGGWFMIFALVLLLLRWTFDTTIRTEYATIALFWR